MGKWKFKDRYQWSTILGEWVITMRYYDYLIRKTKDVRKRNKVHFKVGLVFERMRNKLG